MKISTKIKFQCEFCGKPFWVYPSVAKEAESRGTTRKYCGHTCMYGHRKTEAWRDSHQHLLPLVCQHCHQTFYRLPGDIRASEKKTGSRPRFCGRKCADDYRTTDSYKANNELVVDRICEHCNRTFFRFQSEMRKAQSRGIELRFCGRECRNAARKEVELQCEQCGASFNRHNSVKGRSRFCSLECKRKSEQNQVAVMCDGCFTIFAVYPSTMKRHDRYGYCGHFCSAECRNRHVFTGSKAGYRSDLGFAVRSTWEANFARILKAQGIDFEYEPDWFDLGDCRYLPDFKVGDDYYEIKGWMRPDAKRKLEAFRRLYPDIALHLVAKEQYGRLTDEWKHRIPEWEG